MRDKGVDTSEEFDRVLVTTGPFSRPFVPKLEGIENYKGETMHSQQYKGSVRLSRCVRC
jgi:cation diffusion facilitator CzcD-associated flavoprotein CzcO